jgi:hypothetical protein
LRDTKSTAGTLTGDGASPNGGALSVPHRAPFLSFVRDYRREAAKNETELKTMFAVVRTGGKQYRVAAGDKIAV